jgi:TonB family protein
VLADLRRSTPLIAPPRELTQREPNRGKISPEVNLPGLLARNSPVPLPPSAPAPTRPAAPRTVDAPPVPAAEPPPAPEPPKIEPARPEPSQVAANLPKPGIPEPPPPAQIEPVEKQPQKPKLAFESINAQSAPGAGQGTGGARRVIETPVPASIHDAARAVARSGGGGLAVGDIGAAGSGGLGAALSGTSGLRQASSLELLSDPEGVDFKPYLIQILSTIRRNWLAVLPESARLGRRGRVQIQFAVDRSGGIPKLVIAEPSGAEALDRAAVAGISASNPLPPLPREFKGEQVRLQFTFLYNISAR